MKRLTTFQLATRLETDPGQVWMAAVAEDAPMAARLGHQLAEDLEAFGGEIRIIAPTTSAEVVRAVTPEATCLILGDGLDAAAWSALDRARSRLEHAGKERVVFVLSEAARDRAASHAPNLWSFLASAVYEIGDDEPLDEAGREARLARLREAHGLTDEELIARCEAGQQAPSPDVAEWLILLGRADLLPTDDLLSEDDL